MNDTADMMARQGRILARLSELGLALAEAVQERALCAETPAEARDMTLAFHRISRSVRQSLALEAKLHRQHQKQDREARVDADHAVRDRTERRRTQVKLAVERLIWTESESSEAERLLDDFDDLLEAEVLAEDFMAAPVEAIIARLCRELGLSAQADAAPPIRVASSP